MTNCVVNHLLSVETSFFPFTVKRLFKEKDSRQMLITSVPQSLCPADVAAVNLNKKINARPFRPTNWGFKVAQYYC